MLSEFYRQSLAALVFGVCLVLISCSDSEPDEGRAPASDREPTQPNLSSEPNLPAPATQIPPMNSNLLTIYILPSPKPLNWRTPNTLARSIVANQYLVWNDGFSHFIGHVHVKLQCGLDSNQPYEILTGMTTTTSVEDIKLLLVDRIGLGVLFKDDYQGALDSPVKAKSDIDARIGRLDASDAPGELAFLRMQINETSCARMKNYFVEYSKIPDLRFGFPNRPRYREGSGCSAFGMSFMELGGLVHPEFPLVWQREIHAPEDLIGSPAQPVNFFKVILGFRDSWGIPGSRSKHFRFWDPGLMYNWVHGLHQAPSSSTTFKPVKEGMGWGAEADFRGVATPTEPIFLDSESASASESSD